MIGTIELLDHVERRFTDEEVAVAEGVAKLVALAMEHAQLYSEIRRLHLANLRALSSALSAKDYYTLGHASRVAGYAALLGQELGWPEERLTELQNAAFLHDIGKIGVSDRVLLKAGPLTSEEWELVRQHPGISAEIAQPLFNEELVAGIRHHHEHYDGGGYPEGLAAEDIPEVGRALCVVDCYDAMSSERPYRHALSYRQCLAELRRSAGTQFDPRMVQAFLGALRRLRRRRTEVDRLAARAAALIDPAAHVLLRARNDEVRPEYARMVEALRAFRDEHPPVRFVTSFSNVGGDVISVLDTGESDTEISHVGDHWLAQDELAAVLAGGRSPANVLNADDYGVWVTGTAPICTADGTVVGAVTVDVPALEWAPSLQSDQTHTLTAIVRAATIRYSRAEVEAITDGLTASTTTATSTSASTRSCTAPSATATRSACCSWTATTSRRSTTPTGTRRATRRWRASPVCWSRAAAAWTWRRDTAARSSCWCSSGPARPGPARWPSACAPRSPSRAWPPARSSA